MLCPDPRFEKKGEQERFTGELGERREEERRRGKEERDSGKGSRG